MTSGASNDLADGESREVKGSGSRVYTLQRLGPVYSCTCPAWMHQGFAIERRTCKHLKALRGEEAEKLRTGGPLAQRTAAALGSVPAPAPAPPAFSVGLGAGGVPSLLLAHAWENDVDPTGWWLSEKLDGVRAYWTGSKLVSRAGNTFYAPDWFLEALPRDMPLDGELFGGRGKFQWTVSVVRRQDRSPAWRQIQFLIFDAPGHAGLFEERLRAVEELLEARSLEHVRAHPHVRCNGVDHLREELARVEGLGGEGLMMRKPGSRYESGRSSTLLKVKTFHDAEAIVTGHSPGAGKHKGRLGALECDLPNGTPFSVGTGLSDAERDNPPAIGTVITFRYQELTSDGVPRFPVYVGVRLDATWPPGAEPAKVEGASPPKPSPAEDTSRDARIFVKNDGSWEITLSGASHTIRERRGLAVKTVSESFAGAAAAWRDADAKIAVQLASGWTELVDAS
ncbi:MAG TPA: DNA ligase [Labilithrix sp.]|nr:DNA ligase [Labilithrix sp.]